MVKGFSGAIGSLMPSCQHAPQPKYEIFPGRDPILGTYLTLEVLYAGYKYAWEPQNCEVCLSR